MTTQSPFITHRDKVLGHYSTASWLRDVVMALHSGSSNPVGLSQLWRLDAAHFAAFQEMVAHYYRHGESDHGFVQLIKKVQARRVEERQAVEREAEFEAWLREAKKCLRESGKPAALGDDRYEWFSRRFDAGDSPGAAATACRTHDDTKE